MLKLVLIEWPKFGAIFKPPSISLSFMGSTPACLRSRVAMGEFFVVFTVVFFFTDR
jgi:hypothetical protein